MKQTHKKHGLDAETLRHLYVELRLSDREIAGRFGLTDVAVSYFRRKYGIATFSQRDRIGMIAKDAGLRDVRDISKDEFAKLYLRHGERGLAKMFGSSRQLIRSLRQDFGVMAMDKDARIVATFPKQLTESQSMVLYGSLLGDGGLAISVNGKTARYHEFHSFGQLEYLRWKQAVLKPFSSRIFRSDKVLEDGRIAYGNVFNTCFHSLFLEFWNKFYGTGEKRLPADFETALCPMVMAAWYMDDGHLSDRSKDGVFTLASGLPKEDIDRIMARMNEMGWDVEAKPNQEDNITILWINNKDRFHRFIAPHVHASMSYKLPVSLRGEMPSSPRWKEHIEMFRVDWDGMSDDKVDREVEKFFRYWRSVGFSYPYCSKEYRQREINALKNSRLDLSSGVIPPGHSQGSSFCLSFFDGFWSAHRKGKKSPLQVFEDDQLFRHAIRDCIKYRKSLADSDLRMEIQTFGGVHNFRPAVAKAIYDSYCPAGGSILDPCAGWGGRLLGFLVSCATRYTGIEVERETVKGLRMMAVRLEKELPDKSVEIYNSAFESWDTAEKFDLVFTSPPYFNAEWYGHSTNQSSTRYPEYEQWRDCFLFALIDRAAGMLKKGGRLILNVANTEGGPVADDARSQIEMRLGVAETLKIVLPSPYGGEPRSEDVIVSVQAGDEKIGAVAR